MVQNPAMRTVAAALLALLAAACVGPAPSPNAPGMTLGLSSVAATGTIAIALHDLRKHDAPGASEMREALVKAIESRGARPTPVAVAPSDSLIDIRDKLLDARARRAVLVTLREWRVDRVMLRAEFHYDATVSVFDERGSQLASNSLRGTDALGYSQAGGETITKATAAKLDALFADPLIAGALR